MGWEAKTAFSSVRVGARLCIFESPQNPRNPPPQLLGDHPIIIEIFDRDFLQAHIEKATKQSAILVLPDGQRFQISPLKPGEFDSSITLPTMHYEDWVVRAEL